MGEFMKCELIEENADEAFSEYTLGPTFIDFCRGPHVPSTKRLKAFKVLSISGLTGRVSRKAIKCSASMHCVLHARRSSMST